MLFVLTGHVQTGKTRWLESLVDDLERAGVTPVGVIAPGVWTDRRDSARPCPHADANGFEKLGIDNVLLPSRERVSFARRADLAAQAGEYDPDAQSAQANLSWHISDEAIAHVNGHFKRICDARGQGAPGARLLVIDELGRLELEREQGLTHAVRALQAGPAPHMRHALVVVREELLPCIEGRFGRWGETALVHPDDDAREAIMDAVAAGR